MTQDTLHVLRMSSDGMVAGCRRPTCKDASSGHDNCEVGSLLGSVLMHEQLPKHFSIYCCWLTLLQLVVIRLWGAEVRSPCARIN